MNRIIKFRVWNKEGKYMSPHEDCLVYGTNRRPTLCIHLESPDEIWMQYTGLKDKNGREIYEGDICSGHSDGNGIIKWTDYDGGYNYEFDDGNIVGIWEVKEELVVIGNIYENPELLSANGITE